MADRTLHERLGGYDAISAVANDLLPRLQSDPRLGRFWQHRGAGQGMGIDERDWSAFLGHLNATLDAFRVPRPERDQVLAFVQSTKHDIVEG